MKIFGELSLLKDEFQQQIDSMTTKHNQEIKSLGESFKKKFDTFEEKIFLDNLQENIKQNLKSLTGSSSSDQISKPDLLEEITRRTQDIGKTISHILSKDSKIRVASSVDTLKQNFLKLFDNVQKLLGFVKEPEITAIIVKTWILIGKTILQIVEFLKLPSHIHLDTPLPDFVKGLEALIFLAQQVLATNKDLPNFPNALKIVARIEQKLAANSGSSSGIDKLTKNFIDTTRFLVEIAQEIDGDTQSDPTQSLGVSSFILAESLLNLSEKNRS